MMRVSAHDLLKSLYESLLELFWSERNKLIAWLIVQILNWFTVHRAIPSKVNRLQFRDKSPYQISLGITASSEPFDQSLFKILNRSKSNRDSTKCLNGPRRKRVTSFLFIGSSGYSFGQKAFQ